MTPLNWTTENKASWRTLICHADSPIGEMSVVRASGKGKPHYIARQKGIPLSRAIHKTVELAQGEAQAYVEAKS